MSELAKNTGIYCVFALFFMTYILYVIWVSFNPLNPQTESVSDSGLCIWLTQNNLNENILMRLKPSTIFQKLHQFQSNREVANDCYT